VKKLLELLDLELTMSCSLLLGKISTNESLGWNFNNGGAEELRSYS